jgi:hypothetical protein
MQERRKRANYLLAGLAAVVVIAGAIGYQMTQNGQPTPPAQNAATADQKR